MLFLLITYAGTFVIHTFQGIWGGMLIGTVVQTCVLFWLNYRTNWNKEVTNFIGATLPINFFFFSEFFTKRTSLRRKSPRHFSYIFQLYLFFLGWIKNTTVNNISP